MPAQRPHPFFKRLLPGALRGARGQPLLDVRLHLGQPAIELEVTGQDQRAGGPDQDAVQVVGLAPRRARRLPEMRDGVLGGSGRARAAHGLHGEPGDEAGLDQRADRRSGIRLQSARGGDGLARGFEGEIGDGGAEGLTGQQPGQVPVQVGDELGQQVSQAGEDEDARGPAEHLQIADDDLGGPRRDGLVIARRRAGRRWPS